MNDRQFDTAMNLLNGLIENNMVSYRESWEVEGAIIDIYNGDGDGFLHSMEDHLQKIANQILRTIGFAS